ncbi:MAG: hypothetical protein EOP32_24980 [Rhodococcus sp. (in: high G+C Gram-positive bacteria)]|nr:MAG: hypothetical protein EOP32_24980 [Rhodococcus sp. (in: high G+C Gram-positive bacteria)]
MTDNDKRTVTRGTAMRRRPWAECAGAGCNAVTRSAVGLCPEHKPPTTVGRWGNGVSILGHQLTEAQAYELANRIVDVLEGGTS